MIWVQRKEECFCGEGWTGGITLNWLEKLDKAGVAHFDWSECRCRMCAWNACEATAPHRSEAEPSIRPLTPATHALRSSVDGAEPSATLTEPSRRDTVRERPYAAACAREVQVAPAATCCRSPRVPATSRQNARDEDGRVDTREEPSAPTCVFR